MELKIQTENALRAHGVAGNEGKKLLEALFGADVFTPKNIMDRVKTFEDACEIEGIDPESVIDINDSIDEIAYKKLKIIIRALNQGFVFDWTDSNQYKYYPYFRANSSGFGFAYNDCDRWDTVTLVGSRLAFKSRELAEYAGKQFIDLYNDFMTIQ